MNSSFLTVGPGVALYSFFLYYPICPTGREDVIVMHLMRLSSLSIRSHQTMCSL